MGLCQEIYVVTTIDKTHRFFVNLEFGCPHGRKQSSGPCRLQTSFPGCRALFIGHNAQNNVLSPSILIFSLIFHFHFGTIKMLLGAVVESPQDAVSHFPLTIKSYLSIAGANIPARTMKKELDDETKSDFRMPDRNGLPAGSNRVL